MQRLGMLHSGHNGREDRITRAGEPQIIESTAG